jgi:hypothetical protein
MRFILDLFLLAHELFKTQLILAYQTIWQICHLLFLLYKIVELAFSLNRKKYLIQINKAF